MSDLAGPTLDVTCDEAWTGTRRPLGTATGLPPACYTDPDVHRIELERVFERSWVGVALTADLIEPGTVLVRPVGRRSIVLTVDADGRHHGFLNACRHRGTELVGADCSVRGTIRCPYHRWAYGLDGELRSTPRAVDGPSPIDPAGLDLVPVRLATIGCLVLACLDPRTPPVDDRFGDLDRRLAGYRLDRWTVADRVTVDVEANWKLISENFQEYYHLPWIHPGLATVSRVEDHYRYQGSGLYCGQTTTPVTDDDGSTWLGLPPMAGLDASDGQSGRHLALFPNVVISVLPNHAFVARLEPLGPARTREHISWLLPPETGPSAITAAERSDAFAALRRFWLEVNGEDIEIVERSQRGLRAGAVPPGPLVPRFEEPLLRFHRILADHLTIADPAAIPVPAGDRPGADEALGGRPNPLPPSIDHHEVPS